MILWITATFNLKLKLQWQLNLNIDINQLFMELMKMNYRKFSSYMNFIKILKPKIMELGSRHPLEKYY